MDEKRLEQLRVELCGAPHPENEGQKEVEDLIHLARLGLWAEKLIPEFERLDAGFSGMFGSNTKPPFEDGYYECAIFVGDAMKELQAARGDR